MNKNNNIEKVLFSQEKNDNKRDEMFISEIPIYKSSENSHKDRSNNILQNKNFKKDDFKNACLEIKFDSYLTSDNKNSNFEENTFLKIKTKRTKKLKIKKKLYKKPIELKQEKSFEIPKLKNPYYTKLMRNNKKDFPISNSKKLSIEENNRNFKKKQSTNDLMKYKELKIINIIENVTIINNTQKNCNNFLKRRKRSFKNIYKKCQKTNKSNYLTHYYKFIIIIFNFSF